MFRLLARLSARMPCLASRSSDMGSMPFWFITTKPLFVPLHTCIHHSMRIITRQALSEFMSCRCNFIIQRHHVYYCHHIDAAIYQMWEGAATCCSAQCMPHQYTQHFWVRSMSSLHMCCLIA